jgi:hypothetical protein
MEQSPERCDRRRALVGLVGVCLVVVVVAATFQSVQSRALVHEQITRRGRYIAVNLAYNSRYGVLTEDRPLLAQMLEGAAGGYAGADVAGGSIRDATGAVLAEVGAAVSERPTSPPDRPDERMAVTTDGREVLLFRCPLPATVRPPESAADAGSSVPIDPPLHKYVGAVEVALLTQPASERATWILLETLLVALLTLAAASAVAWTLFLCPSQSREGPEPM